MQQQLLKIDLLIKSGSSKTQIEKAFKELEALEAGIEKTKEETKKIKGGRMANELGTDTIDTAKEGIKEIFDNVSEFAIKKANQAKKDWNIIKKSFRSPKNSAKKIPNYRRITEVG